MKVSIASAWGTEMFEKMQMPPQNTQILKIYICNYKSLILECQKEPYKATFKYHFSSTNQFQIFTISENLQLWSPPKNKIT